MKGCLLENGNTSVREKQSWGVRGENGKMKAPQTTGRWIGMRVSIEIMTESRKTRFRHSSAGTEVEQADTLRGRPFLQYKLLYDRHWLYLITFLSHLSLCTTFSLVSLGKETEKTS